MKKFIWVILLMMTIVSCEKELLLDNSENDGQTSLVTSHLSITTRAVDDEGQLQAVKQGRVYVFNAQGNCVSVLSTTAEEGAFSTELPIGTYTLYAVGADDLDRYVLPTQDEATPTSIITCAEGKTLGDLLLKKANIELKRKATNKLTLDLKRQVLCLSQVQINNVPTDVTSVEVTLSPLYSGVTLSETYSDTNPQSTSIALEKGTNDGLWQSPTATYLFPSNGEPTITITFTTPEGTETYAYSTTQTLEANHHVILSGTYEGHQGVSLTGVLLSEKWGENITITFGFDDPTVTPDPDPNPNPDPTDTPVAGQFFHNYYVVSVDDANRKAVLLSKAKVNFTTTSYTQESSLLAAFVKPLAELAKPVGYSCEEWRVPEETEVEIFSKDEKIVVFGSNGCSALYYCFSESGSLEQAYTKKISETEFQFRTAPGLTNDMTLRPVINITY